MKEAISTACSDLQNRDQLVSAAATLEPGIDIPSS